MQDELIGACLVDIGVSSPDLLSIQVHVSMSSLLATEGDQNARKQYLRSLLARFTRRQPGRSDNDWINLWQDFRAFHESSQFLDKEYLLAEFCRGLLKAGKLSLAKSYLKGNATSVVLPKELVEKIVLHAAREYFYAASSLDSSEVCCHCNSALRIICLGLQIIGRA